MFFMEWRWRTAVFFTDHSFHSMEWEEAVELSLTLTGYAGYT
jgi:hypothetical protein